MNYTDKNPLKRVDAIFAKYAEELAKQNNITFIESTRVIAETAKNNGVKTIYFKVRMGRKPSLLQELL